MDVVFLGTPGFALPTLQALIETDSHRVAGVVTQPDRPRGRGKKLAPPPVKEAALAAGLDVLQATDVNSAECLEWIRARSPEAGVVVAFGQFLKKALREIPPHGFINLHASLLPKYRGAAPIHAAIREGELETGVSIMQVERRMDAGAVFATATTAIAADDTTGAVEARLAAMGAPLMIEVLDALSAGRVESMPQDEALATLAPRIEAADRRVNWQRPAGSVHDHVRSLTPHPGAVTMYRPLEGEPFMARITRTRVGLDRADPPAPAGTIVGQEGRAVRVAVEGGTVLVERLVPAGSREMDAVDFLSGKGRGSGRFVFDQP